MESTWPTLGILLAGIIVVIGSVLVLRLHAFLALTLGALLVALLTPAATVERYGLDTRRFEILAVPGDSADVLGEASGLRIRIGDKQWLDPGMKLLALRPADDGDYSEIAALEVAAVEPVSGRTFKQAILTGAGEGNDLGGIQMSDIIVTPVDRRSAASLSKQTIGSRVASGFGSTAAKIGILIAMASIIGTCLLESGAADRIVRATLRILGERGAPLSFMISGFLLGIPVFFDTVFYLMIPLGKAMRMRTGRNYLLYVLTIVSGATMAHSLVPPTPGPLFVAEQLGVDIGAMILVGGIVGLFCAAFGYFYSYMASRLWELPLRESPEFSFAELEQIVQREDSELPPTWLSLLPILLPVLLIGGNTALAMSLRYADPAWLAANGSWIDQVKPIAATLGDKNIALVVSAAIALAMVVWQKRTSLEAMSGSIQASIASAGVIILITSAGGAFGEVLKQTGVASLIGQLTTESPLIIIGAAWLITAAIRTAQGSATVAMITSVGILAGLATSGELGFHPVWLAVAIGSGSKPIGWMNDSGFWVITKMSGMTEAEGLKYITPMTSLMGVVGLIVTMIGVTLFPMG